MGGVSIAVPKPFRSRKVFFDVLEDRNLPSSYTVNTLSDAPWEIQDPKTGRVWLSLRAAINYGNADPDSDATVNFSVSGTINLVNGQLPTLVGKTWEINGAGITVDGGGNSGIFAVNAPDATINGICLQNAANSAALSNWGTLTINGGQVLNSQAGGIINAQGA